MRLLNFIFLSRGEGITPVLIYLDNWKKQTFKKIKIRFRQNRYTNVVIIQKRIIVST